ncbi:10031_t:CDS:1, partial [Scutellospora calospora]
TEYACRSITSCRVKSAHKTFKRHLVSSVFSREQLPGLYLLQST